MTPTKLLVGQIIVVFVIVVLGVWAATQWAASMLGYQPQLGSAWHLLLGLPLYRPWQLFGWWYHYNAYAPAVFDKAGALAGASGFMGCASAITGSLWRARQNRRVTTYGSSRWAACGEIERAGLFRNAGVFLGRLGRDYLRHDGPEHVMAFAPTRSGKGVGLVVPTLLSWTGSTVVHDIKGENWTLTAGWRSRFSHCLLFNPTDPRSARYNPLLEVRKGPDEVRDVQNIADILVDPRYAEGYKSGGYNFDFVTAESFPDGLEFGKETVKNYETGLKGSVLNGGLGFSLAAFIANYSNYQINQFRDLGGGAQRDRDRQRRQCSYRRHRAGSQRTSLQGVTLSGGIGILSARYRGLPVDADTTVNGELPAASKFQGNGSVAYETAIGGGGLTFRSNLTFTYRSPYSHQLKISAPSCSWGRMGR